MRFVGEDDVQRGIRTRRFEVVRGERTVPGLLWTPYDAQGQRPLVLIGHGASGSKAEEYVVALARRLVHRHEFAAAAIDGPIHGDRTLPGADDPTQLMMVFAKIWGSDPTLTDEMIADWRAALTELQAIPEVGAGPVGYWGLSMGTIFGLPLVAAESQIKAAVLGLMGNVGPTKERIIKDAADVTCPLLFLLQWDDELFKRESAFELFDLIGSSDKRLHANKGTHAAVPSDEFEATQTFLARQLQG
jgi:dienelactone hydrolase